MIKYNDDYYVFDRFECLLKIASSMPLAKSVINRHLGMFPQTLISKFFSHGLIPVSETRNGLTYQIKLNFYGKNKCIDLEFHIIDKNFKDKSLAFSLKDVNNEDAPVNVMSYEEKSLKYKDEKEKEFDVIILQYFGRDVLIRMECEGFMPGFALIRGDAKKCWEKLPFNSKEENEKNELLYKIIENPFNSLEK